MGKLRYLGTGRQWIPEQHGSVRHREVTRDLPAHIYDGLVQRADFEAVDEGDGKWPLRQSPAAYLKRHPDGKWVDLAHRLITEQEE